MTTKIAGVSHPESARRGDEFHQLLRSKVGQTLHTVVRDVDRVPTLDDLGTLLGYWTRHVDQVLLPHVRDAYQAAATAQRARVRGVLRADAGSAAEQLDDEEFGDPHGVTLDETILLEGFDLPVVGNTAAEMYLADARNRLVNVGNDVWEEARNGLLDGLQAGENIKAIQARIYEATDLSYPRAGVVARTEINGALNAGTIAQMRLIDVDGMTKEWLAVGDSRTRPTHLAADKQTVPIKQPFIVDGQPWDVPGDTNCRCGVGYNLP